MRADEAKQRVRGALVIAVLASGPASCCAAQSLGDVALQARAQKHSPAATARHVITEDDLPKQAQAEAADAKPSEQKSNSKIPEADAPQNADSEKPTAAEMQEKIKAQKQSVSALKSRIGEIQGRLDAWKSSDCTRVYYVDAPNENPCKEIPQLKAAQDRAKSDLAKHQSELEATQEEARRLGYGNSVYDPD